MMEMNELYDDQQMRATALRLVRCLGSRNALKFCKNNQWQGLYEVIQNLDKSASASQ